LLLVFHSPEAYHLAEKNTLIDWKIATEQNVVFEDETRKGMAKMRLKIAVLSLRLRLYAHLSNAEVHSPPYPGARVSV
jgi:hypothetical protein